MDEQLKAKLTSYLDTLETKVKAGTDFVATETPLTIQEWIQWQVVDNGVYAAVFIVAGIVTFFVCRSLSRIVWRQVDNFRDGSDEKFFVGAGSWTLLATGVTVLVVFLFHALGYTLQATKAVVSPRVVIVEKVAELTGIANGKKK